MAVAAYGQAYQTEGLANLAVALVMVAGPTVTLLGFALLLAAEDL